MKLAAPVRDDAAELTIALATTRSVERPPGQAARSLTNLPKNAGAEARDRSTAPRTFADDYRIRDPGCVESADLLVMGTWRKSSDGDVSDRSWSAHTSVHPRDQRADLVVCTPLPAETGPV